MWQNCQDDSDTLSTGSISWTPSSNVRAYAEEHLVITVMKNNDIQPTRLQTHSTTPIGRRKKSAYELGTSGSWSSISNRTTPTLSRPARTSPHPPSPSPSHSPSFPLSPPLSAGLSRPTSGSSGVELGTVFRPLSRAAQEIMEICGLDQTGCEDPDLHTDTNTYTLSCLERELQLMGNDTGMQAFIAGGRVSGSPGHHRNQALTRNGISEEQQKEEEEAQRDRQSVLSLP
ncbi:uncharacterized protein zbbx [Myripristis murdjan]|uniref:uncharacterized protein zbbx n=1 Tax=Myripristis murdjan TaxID=586833 RepID=UPI001175ED20|nr:uncharacterized protein LOC115370647 [Myripristis murdjan]